MPLYKSYSCNSCHAENFLNLRYCCEICEDYNLCSICYDNGKESFQHFNWHPMKCLPLPIVSQISIPAINLSKCKSMLCNEKYKEDIDETEYLTILFDYCLQYFINNITYYQHINTSYIKRRYADALNWTDGFITKLFGNYSIELDDHDLTIPNRDIDIIFELNDTFVSDIDTGSLSQIGFVEQTEYPGLYYIEYNSKTKYHSILQNLDIFEEENDKIYISSRKILDLLHNEFEDYDEPSPCKVELHKPTFSMILNNGIVIQNFIFSFPMFNIPSHIHNQWIYRSKQWPSDDVIEIICNSIYHLIPKQWKTMKEHEDNDRLTWCLSFNVAEVLLTNSWNERQKTYYLLLKSFVQELTPDLLSLHHIKAFMFTYLEKNNHFIEQTENQIEIFLHLIHSLSLVLKSKLLSNYFIPNINMLKEIPEEYYLYLAGKLDQFYKKPLNTIKQISSWSYLNNYSKIQVYTSYLRSLLSLALKKQDHHQLQRLQHIIELSNTLFPSSKLDQTITDIEEFIFAWLDIIITPSLRKNLPTCFEKKRHHQKSLKRGNKNLFWLIYNLWEPIVLVFNIMDIYFDDNNNTDRFETNVRDEEEDYNEDNFIIIPFLKLNGKPTNRNDYNFIPIRKTQIQSVFEILIGMLCKPLLDLLTYDDNFQYLIDRFHAIGFKNELLSNGFYQAALDKSIMTFKLKYDLYAFEINDPICVNIDKKEYQSIQIRHDIYCEQIQNLFDNACQLSSIETWKIKVHMGYTYYFLFGYYDKAIDLMKSIINTNIPKTDQWILSNIIFTKISSKCPVLTYIFQKLNKTNLVIPTIILAYYTLFQSYRMINQWDNGQEYIEQFKQTCTFLEMNIRNDDYDDLVIKLLLATCFFCIASIDEALQLTFQFLRYDTKLAYELMSLCGIQYLLPGKDVEYFLDYDLTLELPYALSECGSQNEVIHVKAEIINQSPPTLIIRHGYDCYRMRSWLINEFTFLDELKKWMRLLPVAIVSRKE